MTVILEGGCRVSTSQEGEPISNGTLRIWNPIGRATGAQAISLRVMEFASGLSPAIKNDECDQILYIIDRSSLSSDRDREAVPKGKQGHERSAPPLKQIHFNQSHSEGVQGDCRETHISINGRAYHIERNTGIYIRPNETFAINNPGPHPLVVVSSQCPDPNRPPEFASTTLASSSLSDTPGPLIRLADRPAQSTANRWYRVLVDDEVGSTQATQFVGSIPPGRALDHFHNYEEVLFILKGEGRMWAGETNAPIAPGSCIYLPKGQVHCVENTGAGELRLLGVFYPAGSPSVRYDV